MYSFKTCPLNNNKYITFIYFFNLTVKDTKICLVILFIYWFIWSKQLQFYIIHSLKLVNVNDTIYLYILNDILVYFLF